MARIVEFAGARQYLLDTVERADRRASLVEEDLDGLMCVLRDAGLIKGPIHTSSVNPRPRFTAEELDAFRERLRRLVKEAASVVQ